MLIPMQMTMPIADADADAGVAQGPADLARASPAADPPRPAQPAGQVVHFA